jgi:hypothetical protein
MKPEKRVTAAVEKAQEILAQYVEPGPRNCKTAINELMDVLYDNQLIETLDEVKNGRSEKEGIAGPQQDQYARASRGQVLDQRARRGQGSASEASR